MHSHGDSLNRALVEIPTANGLNLPAVVVSPARSTGRPKVIVLCQAGLQNKGGVGDYFRWLGDAFAERGYHTVRFDPLGTGDAPGEIANEISLEEFFVKIQSGVFTEDTAAVVRWVNRRFDDARVILWGQCGGCIPALMVCADTPDAVEALVLMAPPVLYSQPLDVVREFDAQIARRGYLRKLTDPRAYLRLLSGKSEYRLIEAAVRSTLRSVKHRVVAALEAVNPQPEPDHPLFNDHFWEAFVGVMRAKKPVYFLLAERDNESAEFRQAFAPVLQARASFARRCTVEQIDDAEHSLMFEQSRLSSLDQMVGWIEKTVD